MQISPHRDVDAWRTWSSLNFNKEYLFVFETLVFAASGILWRSKENLTSHHMMALTETEAPLTSVKHASWRCFINRRINVDSVWWERPEVMKWKLTDISLKGHVWRFLDGSVNREPDEGLDTTRVYMTKHAFIDSHNGKTHSSTRDIETHLWPRSTKPVIKVISWNWDSCVCLWVCVCVCVSLSLCVCTVCVCVCVWLCDCVCVFERATASEYVTGMHHLKAEK